MEGPSACPSCSLQVTVLTVPSRVCLTTAMGCTTRHRGSQPRHYCHATGPASLWGRPAQRPMSGSISSLCRYSSSLAGPPAVVTTKKSPDKAKHPHGKGVSCFLSHHQPQGKGLEGAPDPAAAGCPLHSPRRLTCVQVRVPTVCRHLRLAGQRASPPCHCTRLYPQASEMTDLPVSLSSSPHHTLPVTQHPSQRMHSSATMNPANE